MTTPLISRSNSRPQFSRGAWLLRLVLAVCLGFASEVLLWTDSTRGGWLWLPLIPGYVVIAAVLLDLMVRFQVRELFGLLLLAGVYALLISWTLNPVVTLQEIPIHLMTRVMGAQFMAGAAGLGLFAVLLRDRPPKVTLIALSALAGAFWGVWVAGYPLVLDDPARLVPLNRMLATGIIGLALVLAGGWVITCVADVTSRMLRLTRLEWAVVVAVLGAMLAMWTLFEASVVNAAGGIITLLVYCVLALWFQANPNAPTWLDRLLPVRIVGWPWLLVSAIVFLTAGVWTFQLPPPTAEAPGALAALSIAFGTLGLMWLPAVSLVLGLRAYRRSLSPDRLL
jgi:hypothetical protein